MTSGTPPEAEGEGPAAREEAPGEERLETRALRGVPWNVLGYVFGRGLTLMATLVLARLLTPADMGLVYTGLLIVSVLNLLTDSGLGLNLVVREELGDRMAGTVLSCMVLAGAIFALAATAASGLLADVFNAPGLSAIMPWLALTVVFTGVAFFYQNLLFREMSWGRRFAGQLAQSAGYAFVAVPAAALGYGVWSMVAGTVVSALAAAVVMGLLSPRRIRPGFHLGEARTAYVESRPFLSQAASVFVRSNGHYMAVAGLLGPRTMGLYSMAYRLSELPAEVLVTPVNQATFPALARMRDEGERSRAAFLTSTRFVVAAGLPITLFLAALAPAFAAGVLGPQWGDITPVLVILSLGGAAALLASSVAWYINASGGASWLGKINFYRMFVVIPAVIVAAAVLRSVETVAWLILVDSLMELALVVGYAQRRLEVPLSSLVAALRGVLLASAALAVAAVGTRVRLEAVGVGPLAQFGAGLAAGAVIYLVALFVFDRQLFRDGIRLTGRLVKRG